MTTWGGWPSCIGSFAAGETDDRRIYTGKHGLRRPQPDMDADQEGNVDADVAGLEP
jgi:hypothetical protein